MDAHELLKFARVVNAGELCEERSVDDERFNWLMRAVVEESEGYRVCRDGSFSKCGEEVCGITGDAYCAGDTKRAR
jgi:hypothetical protein